ncbi:MAG: rod shape-determining protein MreD [Spirochaetota bacterium]
MRTIVAGSILLILIVIGQTNLLRILEIRNVQPDLILIVVVFLAHYHGPLVGESVGFVAGMTEDFLSLAPPGYHALLRTLVGFAAGTTHNRMLLDPIFMPILLMVGATVLKLILGSLLAVLFAFEGSIDPLIPGRAAIEVVYTAVLGPILFAVLKLVPVLRSEQRL